MENSEIQMIAKALKINGFLPRQIKMLPEKLMIRTAACNLALASLALMSVAHGFAAEADKAAPTDGGTAIIVVGSELKTLNPTIITGPGELAIGCAIHDGLIEIRGDGTYEPALAKSWTISDDRRTYTFDLVDAKWHDGQPFTSKDVAYFMTSVTKYAPLLAAQIGNKIEKVETLGDHRVSVTLTQPYGPFLRMLACFNGGAILPEHIYAGTNPPTNPASSAPIGTGPFKFSEWKSGDSIRLVKNDQYWRKGFPHLDGIVVRAMPTAGTRVQALKAGEADYIQRYFMPISDFPTVKADPRLKLVRSSSSPNVLIASFNLTQKPFDQKKVRQALFSVIDRKFILNAVFAGQGAASIEPFPGAITWAADPDIDFDKMYPNDVQAANKALDEVGLLRGAGGIRFKTNITFDAAIGERLKQAIAIQSAWQKLGVEVELRPLEIAVALNRVFHEKNFGVFIESYNSYSDPAVGLARAWLSSSIDRDFGNASRYSNPAVDELFSEAAAASDLTERGAIYRQIQKILADDLPVMSLHEGGGFDAANAKLHGVWGYEGNGRWWNAWMEK